MGLIRFAVHPPDRCRDWPEVHRGYLCGADGRIFPTRIELADGVVGCRRSSSESSKFHVAWPVEGFGHPVLQTASLPERGEPYLLTVELARGKIVQLRNQAANWELAGLVIPDEYHELSKEAHRLFGRAASNQNDVALASGMADQALIRACRAADVLTQAYAQQALAGRQMRYPHLPASLGCELGGRLETAQSDLFLAAFHAVTIPMRWTSIETDEGTYNWDLIDAQVAWAEAQKLVIRSGPLLDFGPGGLPDWLGRWQSDPFNLQSFVCDFVETALGRYSGRIRWWELASRANTGGVFSLNEEQRLTLLARVLEVARHVDEEAQLLIRIDRPWGEYLAAGQHRLAPLQLVDALLRSGVGLTGVNLEIAIGYHPTGTLSRDLIEFSRLIDNWSVLGIPLFITLACPSATTADPLSTSEYDVDPNGARGAATEAAQARWIEEFLPLLMAKPAIAGVTWAHFSDAQPHEFPHAGLLRPDQSAKPAIQTLLQYRRPVP